MNLEDQKQYIRTFASLFFVLQGAGAAAWWITILGFPKIREFFVPIGVPFASLLSLLPGDLILYVVGSLASAYGLLTRKRWVWPLMCVHAGATAYAALYAIMLPMLLSCCKLGAILMLPSLALPLYFAWRLRPRA